MTTPDLSAARTIDSADVYKAGSLAATIRRVDEGVEFRYRAEYLQSNGVPVSPTLPLDAPPRITRGGAVPPVFAGLLPEGRRLHALRSAVKTSVDDELSLIIATGGDAVGDIQVVASGALPPTDVSAMVDVDQGFGHISFTDILAEAGLIDPSALPGVQTKGSAKGLSLPVGAAGDRYILKIDPPEHPGIVRNEAYFLKLARECGLPVADAEVVSDRDGRPGLLVRRFDRAGRDDGTAARLECFDACQLLDRWPADKYNLTSSDVINAVATACGAPTVARRDVYRQLVFAWLTGNGDVHAKNISVLRGTDGEVRVSPAYDLPSTVPYGDLTMALSLDGRNHGLSRRIWLAFASNTGLRERAASRVIDDLLDGTHDLITDIEGGALPFDAQTTHALVGQLKNRRRLLMGH